MFYQTAYAEEIDDSYEIDLNNKKGNHVGRNAYDQERNNLLGIENFKVSSNTALSKNNISFYKYSDLDGDFVSLREVIEALGGSIEWTPNYNSYSLGYFELLGYKYEYESAFLLNPENENVKYKEEFCPIDIYTNIDGHKTI